MNITVLILLIIIGILIIPEILLIPLLALLLFFEFILKLCGKSFDTPPSKIFKHTLKKKYNLD